MAPGSPAPDTCGTGRNRERVERPVAQPGAAHDVLHLDRTEVPRVGRILAMVAHDEQGAVRDDPQGRPAGGGQGLLRDAVDLPEDVILLELDPVDVDEAILQLDLVAGHADDALDEWHGARRPARRRLEHDDVAVRVGVPARGQLVDEHVLLRDQGVLHRALLHLEGLGDEGLDSEEDEDREDESLEDFERTPERWSLAHRLRSIGAVLSSRPVTGCPWWWCGCAG